MHRGRSDTAANANANSDAPRKFASEFYLPNLKEEAANSVLRRHSLANANGFANEMQKLRPHCGNSLRMEVCDKIR